MIDIEPQFIMKIEALREKYPLTHTLTPSRFHLELLDETIALFKAGYRFMPVVGASAVVESCLLAQKRRDSNWNTLEEYFEVETTLSPLIREYIDNPIIPIGELLDRDEDLNTIREKKKQPKFAQLRNKFAHGDIARQAYNQTQFFRLLPTLDELREKYGVDIDDIRIIRWDLPGYVQITKCLKFSVKWLQNLAERRD